MACSNDCHCLSIIWKWTLFNNYSFFQNHDYWRQLTASSLLFSLINNLSVLRKDTIQFVCALKKVTYKTENVSTFLFDTSCKRATPLKTFFSFSAFRLFYYWSFHSFYVKIFRSFSHFFTFGFCLQFNFNFSILLQSYRLTLLYFSDF